MGEDEDDVLSIGAPSNYTAISYNEKPLQCFFIPGIQPGIVLQYSVWTAGSSDGANVVEPELLATGMQKAALDIDLPEPGKMYKLYINLSGIDIQIGGENEAGDEAD